MRFGDTARGSSLPATCKPVSSSRQPFGILQLRGGEGRAPCASRSGKREGLELCPGAQGLDFQLGCQRQLLPGPREAETGDGEVDFLHHRLRALNRTVLEQNPEFAVAQSRYGIGFSKLPPEQSSETSEKLVSGLLAVQVSDGVALVNPNTEHDMLDAR